jgi:predicted nuclease of restriction endonuclease-like (RecB) superfamily
MSQDHSQLKTINSPLFDRVVTILDQARSNVVQSINSNMVISYWLIGREIVEEIQAGEQRAEYGKKVLKQLSGQLNTKYGSGFSAPNLRNFRQFYQSYQNRSIRYPPGSESGSVEKLHLPEGESEQADPTQHPTGVKLAPHQGANSQTEPKRYPSGSELTTGFHPQLSWSHYRALMRVSNHDARDFYEQEAVECGWSKAQLERQIQSSYYERIIDNQGAEGLLPAKRQRLAGEPIPPEQMLKSPFILEFLNLPDSPSLHESDLEQAIIKNLQSFLLELGKGFSFVARQKHIRFDDDDFYIDLVFYNFILKCFVLIDLKIGKLSHGDVGQMDGYVRLFEDRFKVEGDNPTIGLILCSDKSEAVARYSVLSENKQIFASKYLKFLPSEEELKLEIEKERKFIETALGNGEMS